MGDFIVKCYRTLPSSQYRTFGVRPSRVPYCTSSLADKSPSGIYENWITSVQDKIVRTWAARGRHGSIGTLLSIGLRRVGTTITSTTAHARWTGSTSWAGCRSEWGRRRIGSDNFQGAQCFSPEFYKSRFHEQKVGSHLWVHYHEMIQIVSIFMFYFRWNFLFLSEL